MDGGDLEFQAVIEVYPEIQPLDVSDLAIDRPNAGVTDSDVEEMLGTLREQRRSWNPVERAPREGEHVALEYSAETEEGRVPEEGDLRLAVVIGQSGFEDLEKALADLEPGGTKSVELDFPEDFREAELAGQKAKVELKLVSVSESELPEVDEEFVQSFGIEDGSLDSLKVEIRGNLERELKQAETTFLKTQLIDELVDSVPDLEVPASVVREEAAGMAAQLAAQQGQQQPDPSLVEMFMEQANRRVRAGLLLGELANQNDIRIDATKVREAIDTVAGTYEQPEEVVQLYYANPKLLQQVESSVLEEQVVDWVLENAKVTTKDMSFQDVISGASQAAKQA
jgi:trigger factor